MTVTTDTCEVREFVTTYVAQARAATAEIEQPGILNMVLVNPADDDVTSIYRYALDDPNLVENMISDAIKPAQPDTTFTSKRAPCGPASTARTNEEWISRLRLPQSNIAGCKKPTTIWRRRSSSTEHH